MNADKTSFEVVDCIPNRIRETDVMVMALCEQNHVILRPNQLYRFITHTDCKECVRLEREGRHYSES